MFSCLAELTRAARRQREAVSLSVLNALTAGNLLRPNHPVPQAMLANPVVLDTIRTSSDPAATSGVLAGLFVHCGVTVRGVIATDEDGWVYVPGLGYLITGHRSESLVLTVAEDGLLALECGERRVEFERLDAVMVRGHEVPIASIPFLEDVIRHVLGSSGHISFASTSQERAELAWAFDVMGRVLPELRQAIRESVSMVVLFRCASGASFAADCAPGVAFLNLTGRENNEVFLLEDLAHQCGHVLLSLATKDAQGFFRVPALAPLPEAEERSPWVLMHGVVTETLMARCLYGCLQLPDTELLPQRRHEVVGRLASVLRRFAVDISLLVNCQLLAPQGLRLIREFGAPCREIVATLGRRLNDIQLDNQGYRFDFDRFLARNPLGMQNFNLNHGG